MAHRKVCTPTQMRLPMRVRTGNDPARPRLVQQLFWQHMEDGWERSTLNGMLILMHACGETQVCEADALGNRRTRPVTHATLAGALRALDWKVVD